MKKEKIQLLILILLLTSGAVYGYITYLLQPQLQVLADQRAELEVKKEYYRSLLEYEANPARLEDLLRQAEAKKENMENTVPQGMKKQNVMADLYALTKEKGAAPQVVTFSQLDNKGSYDELILDFQFSGSADQVLAVLKEIQGGMKRFYVINAVSMGGNSIAMQCAVHLTAYGMAQIKDTPSLPSYMLTPMGLPSIPSLFLN